MFLRTARVSVAFIALALFTACTQQGCGARHALPIPDDARVRVDVPHLAALLDALAVRGRAWLPARAVEALAQLGPGQRSAAGIAEDARAVLAVREGGDVVLAVDAEDEARVRSTLDVLATKLELTVTTTPDGVRALSDATGRARALIVVEAHRALAWLDPSDLPAARALLVSWAHLETPVSPSANHDGALARLHVDGAWASRHLEQRAAPVQSADLALRADAQALTIEGELALDADTRALAASLTTPATAEPIACALERGAALVLRVPPLDAESATAVDGVAGTDVARAASARLTGSVTLAFYPPVEGTAARVDDLLSLASVIVVGRPRDAAAERDLLASITSVGGAGTSETVAGHTLRTFAPRGLDAHRQVRAVVEPSLFALAIGTADALPRALQATAASCGDAPLRLAADGAVLGPLLERGAAAFTPLPERARAWLSGGDSPIAWVRDAGRWSLAVRAAAAGAHIEVRIAPPPAARP